MKQYNAIDLFCGAGGLSYGFENAGFNILLGIDNDQKALEVFEKNHKGAKSICGDITEINYEQIKEKIGNQKIDIIVGGPPCQGMSLSGPRQFDDPRNKLYLSYIRLVNEIKPRAFVIENVTGLVSLFKGQIKDSIIEKFTAMGYTVKYQILCAADYGVPQNRKRVIFVGTREDAEFIYPEKFQNQVTCEMALSDLPPLENELGEEIADYTTEPMNEYQKLMREHSDKVYNHIAAAHSEKVKKIISLVPDGCNYKSLPEEYRSSRNFHVHGLVLQVTSQHQQLILDIDTIFIISITVFLRFASVQDYNLFQMILFSWGIKHNNFVKLAMQYHRLWHKQSLNRC